MTPVTVDNTINGGENVAHWDNGANWKFSKLGSSNYYKILTTGNHPKALDVVNKKKGNGANIQLWNYGGGTNQQWYFMTTSSGGTHRIVNRNSRKNVGVQGGKTGNGANVLQWEWNESKDQQWYLEKQ